MGWGLCVLLLCAAAAATAVALPAGLWGHLESLRRRSSGSSSSSSSSSHASASFVEQKQNLQKKGDAAGKIVELLQQHHAASGSSLLPLTFEEFENKLKVAIKNENNDLVDNEDNQLIDSSPPWPPMSVFTEKGQSGQGGAGLWDVREYEDWRGFGLIKNGTQNVVKDMETCHDQCQALFECRLAFFEPTTMQCWLDSKLTKIMRRCDETSGRCLTFFKRTSKEDQLFNFQTTPFNESNPSAWKSVYNTDLMGIDRHIHQISNDSLVKDGRFNHVPSSSDCVKQCGRLAYCRVAVYRSDNHQCWLSSQPPLSVGIICKPDICSSFVKQPTRNARELSNDFLNEAAENVNRHHNNNNNDNNNKNENSYDSDEEEDQWSWKSESDIIREYMGEAEPRDCKVSEFGAFSPCSVSCGKGHQTRKRHVLIQPRNDGKPCPELSDVRVCHRSPCRYCKPVQMDNSSSAALQQKDFEGLIWTRVRHVNATSSTWHPATDALRGEDAYGEDDGSNSSFSVKYSDVDFDMFLFSTGDFTHWLITSKSQVVGVGLPGLYPATIAKSSSRNSSYSAIWMLGPNEADVWISEADHFQPLPPEESETHSMLYGERSNPGWPYYRQHHDGADVYIAKNCSDHEDNYALQLHLTPFSSE